MVFKQTGIVATGDPDETSLGPAMLACNPGQRRFVIGKLHGLLNIDAAEAAGYSRNASNAAQLVQNQKVQAAIAEVARGYGVTELIPEALNSLARTMREAPEHRDRTAAAKEVMDRFGFSAKTEHSVSVTHAMLTPEMVATQLEQLAGKFGHDAMKVIDSVSVVEGEFEEVKPVEDELSDLW